MTETEKFKITQDGTLIFARADGDMKIPCGVKKIADGAITDSPRTKRIFIPPCVQEIEPRAMAFFEDLQSVEVDSANKRYKSIENCLVDTYNKTLLLASANGRIPQDANAAVIGEYAFTAARAEEIFIPSNVKSVQAGALRFIRGLKRIEVDGNNAVYHGANNCVIHTANKKLIAFLPNAQIPFDGSVTSIEDGAFLSDGKYAEIFIPPSVEQLDEEKAFGRAKCTIFVCERCSVIRRPVRTFGNSRVPKQSYGSPDIAVKYYCYVTERNAQTEGGALKKYAPQNGQNNPKFLYVPDGINSIDKGAFEGDGHIEGVIIGKDVREIYCSAFCGCRNLRTLSVVPENPYLHAKGNCIIRTEEKRMIIGCTASDVPKNGAVEQIWSAFYGCNGLFNIVIPEGVTYLGAEAFYGCEDLRTVSLPSTLKHIGENVFENCRSLERISYNGTADEFIRIQGSLFINCCVTCTDGQI